MKLIMVDLDGTLFDTREVNYMAYQEAVGQFGYKIDYKYYCEHGNGRHYMDFLPQITTKNSDTLCEMHRRKKQAYSKYMGKARINNRLVDLLRLSKKEYKIALVTTASKENTYELLQKFDLKELFDLILTNEDVVKVKPDPEGYLKAIRYFGAGPEECIVFEDSEVGIEAASKAGILCFAVNGF
ncbi:MAG: HAD family phosphatase [Hungatella sp.]|nr:HAD family phosphatase [Hungatella sp.]